MNVQWTPEAELDRLEVFDYIADDNAAAAIQMDVLFGEAAARLADYPYLGHAGKIPGTHKLIPHKSYRLVYQIDQETIWVLALVSTARRWPPLAGI